ncbi:hypothetical protein PO909_016574 [Leuciscus waleckii]
MLIGNDNCSSFEYIEYALYVAGSPLVVEEEARSESSILIPAQPAQGPPVDHTQPNPEPTFILQHVGYGARSNRGPSHYLLQTSSLSPKSMPVGILVVIDEESLIDWESDVVLPTLPTHKPSLPLVPSWTNKCLSPLSSSSPLVPPSLEPLMHSLSLVLSIPSSSSPPAMSFKDFRAPPHPSEPSVPPWTSSAMAPRPLGSTWDHRPICSNGLPRPTGSALVSHRPTIATNFRAVCYAPSLHVSGYTEVLTHTGITIVLWPLGSTTASHHLDSTLVSLSVSVTGSLCPSDVAWASRSHCVTSVTLAKGTTLASPSSLPP